MAAGEVIGDAVANDSAAGDDYFGVGHHGLGVLSLEVLVVHIHRCAAGDLGGNLGCFGGR